MPLSLNKAKLDKLSGLEVGYINEELLRRFSEQSGEEAGEHFTPAR